MIVKIDDLDHNGRGITRVNNKITFVENALENEIVEIRITKEKKNYNEATLIKIIESNLERRKPLCPYYGQCGGCEIMHMNYNKQLDYKKAKVENILKKYANININLKIIPSNNEFNYRNKITLHEKNGLVGYMKKESNEIIKVDNCPLAMESINSYISKNINNTKDKIVIRTNEKGEIISTQNDKKLIIKINEYKFQVDIKSFFQINNYICSEIFNFLEQNIKNINTTLDLYSGVGTLSIIASKKSQFVYSIEVNENSHKNAIKNMELNNIKNIKFILGKVENEINKIKEKIDLIITDPPRSGMDKKTINIIKKLRPYEIIYISCNPMTLARDLNILKEMYNIEFITLFDMFPNTSHIESMCKLKLQEQ